MGAGQSGSKHWRVNRVRAWPVARSLACWVFNHSPCNLLTINACSGLAPYTDLSTQSKTTRKFNVRILIFFFRYVGPDVCHIVTCYEDMRCQLATCT